MPRTRRRSLALGLLAVALALTLFGWLVGYRRLVATVAALDPLPFALGFVAAAVGMGCRFLALAALLDVRPRGDALLAYLRGFYGQQLLPVGNVAGPVLIAYSMETATGISTDRALPGTIIAQAATFLGSTTVALVGALLLVGQGQRALLPVAGVLVVVSVVWLALLVALIAGVDLDPMARALGAALRHTLGRVSTQVAERTAPDAIDATLTEFDAARRLIRDDTGRVVLAFGWVASAWLLFSLPAVTTGIALGTPIPLAVALVAVPVSDLLNVLPVPGGVGGVEAVMAGLFVAIGGVDAATAVVAAFCVRLCTYWFVLVLGGAATAVAAARRGP
ncbi:MAG: flippase-like domain-containing protein [Halolamina sp.]